MNRIILLCQNGASTGLCVNKMKEYVKSEKMNLEIKAYSYTQLPNIVDVADCLLLGPQIGFKLDAFKKEYPKQAHKFDVIDAIDFGMLDGEKIVKKSLYQGNATRGLFDDPFYKKENKNTNKNVFTCQDASVKIKIQIGKQEIVSKTGG